MSLGLSQKLNILQQSPHDLQPPEPPSAAEEGMIRWVASRYAVRAITADGRLILWNTYNGAMVVLRAELRSAVEGLLTRKSFAARPLGMVKYLCDRGFLVKEGTDEYRRIQAGFGSQHYRTDRLELILLASEDCNLRCEYCYEDFARGTMQPWVREGIKRLVEKRLFGLRALSVSWFGGEPLYGFAAIEDLAPFFLETAEKHSLDLSGSMTTNGYLLTPEMADKLLAWKVRKFQITVDGTPEDHDRNRPARDGQGTFWTIFNNLRAMHRRTDDFEVDFRVNFDRRNYPQMGDFLAMVKEELGGDARFKMRFRSVGQWGGPNDEKLDVCGTDEGARIGRELREEARRRGLNVADDIRDIKGMGAHVCYAARPYNFIVGASGKLMKCTIDLDKQDRNVVGHLKENGEMELDVDKLALWTEPAFENDNKCKKCVVLPICQGTFCPQVRMDTGDSPCTPLRMTYKQELRATVEAAGKT
ncbi:MAG TPA: radical SAM protein [Thermoanaerobaculia bacterium]|jgi:uncharacterized protein